MGNIKGQFLYTIFETTDSPIGVDTKKSSFKMYGKISNFLDINGVTKDNVEPG